jgi:2-haloacid dehalogenase
MQEPEGEKPMKYLLFDLDDTILDFHKAEGLALRKTLTQIGIEPTPEILHRYSQINQSRWELLEEQKITRAQVLTSRFDILFAELGVSRSSDETQALYEHLLSQGHFFLPGAEELLELLYPNYDLYLVSNGTAPVQAGRIQSSGIAHYFEKIFISEEIGVDKPQKAFFDRCFAQIPGFQHAEAIIIGDSLTSDIRGGNLAGIQTCWYNPQRKPRRPDIFVDHEITHLLELSELLKGL